MTLQALAFVAAIVLGSWALLELVLATASRCDPTAATEPAPTTEDVR